MNTVWSEHDRRDFAQYVEALPEDELLRQMFQIMVDEPEARWAYAAMMRKVDTGISWLTGVAVLSTAVAIYLLATKK